MKTSKSDIANAFLNRTDLSSIEEKIKHRCIAAQQEVDRVRALYESLVQEFNNVRQKATEKELELLSAQKHLEALVDLIGDLDVSPDKESEGDK